MAKDPVVINYKNNLCIYHMTKDEFELFIGDKYLCVKRIEELKAKNKVLNKLVDSDLVESCKRIEELEAENKDLKKLVEDLKSENHHLEESLNELEDIKASRGVLISSLQFKNTILKYAAKRTWELFIKHGSVFPSDSELSEVDAVRELLQHCGIDTNLDMPNNDRNEE